MKKIFKSKLKSKKAKWQTVVSGRWSVVSALLFFLLTVQCSLITASAQTRDFTYQGRLLDNSLPATANYDFEFSVWDSLVAGTQVGTTETVTGVAVTNGIFTVRLLFNGAFSGEERFLQIAVRPAGGGAYTTLAPRQPFTSAPYSIRSGNAASASGLDSSCVLCVTDSHISQVSGSKVTGTVANATTANNVSGIVAIANGGTGSATKNFVDLTTNQTSIGGNKTFTGILSGNGSGLNNVPGTLKWNEVTGTSQQAVSNNGYIVNNAAEVTVTLPAAPIVGDIVRVTAVGTGGWKIVQNAGQSIHTGNIITPGLNWTARSINADWRAVASSADGTKLVAVIFGGQIYTSSNSGITWTSKESNRNWVSVASSADGTKLVAVVNGGQIYTSTNSGDTWTPRESNRQWRSVASSADGTKLVAGTTGSGETYRSTNSGLSWVASNPGFFFSALASSADGIKLAAGNSSSLTHSTDSGTTWIDQFAVSSSQGVQSIASSSDGTKLVAVTSLGALYTSTNSGIDWVPRDHDRFWFSVASSSDGSKLVAVGLSTHIYTSTDSGLTWTARDIVRGWRGVASSSDGSKLVAVVDGGQIYTSQSATTTSGILGSLQGSQYSSIELQYVGGGMFIPLSNSGSIYAN